MFSSPSLAGPRSDPVMYHGVYRERAPGYGQIPIIHIAEHLREVRMAPWQPKFEPGPVTTVLPPQLRRDVVHALGQYREQRYRDALHELKEGVSGGLSQNTLERVGPLVIALLGVADYAVARDGTRCFPCGRSLRWEADAVKHGWVQALETSGTANIRPLLERMHGDLAGLLHAACKGQHWGKYLSHAQGTAWGPSRLASDARQALDNQHLQAGIDAWRLGGRQQERALDSAMAKLDAHVSDRDKTDCIVKLLARAVMAFAPLDVVD